MIKVTTRYLASNFIPPFVLGFVFFVAFLITFYMFRIISLIVNKGVEVGVVLGMVTNLSVSFFPLAAPLAVFFATIYTLNKLSDDSEIIAMRSFGLTKFKIYLPFLIVSLLIGGTVFSLSSIYIPKANANFKNTIVKLTSTGMLTSIKSGQFFTDIPNATLFAETVSGDGDNFNEVFLHVRDKSAAGQRIIFAKKGSLIKIFADQWHAPSLRMHLTNGNIVKLNTEGEQIEKVLFNEYDFPIFSAEFASTLLDKDSMKTNKELLNTIEIRQRDFTFTERTLPANPEEINARKEAKKSIVKSEIEYYSRLITLPQIVLFVLLAFSLGIKKGRGEGSGNSVRAIIFLLGYYGVYFFMLSLAQRGVLGALPASFAPSVLLLFVSLYYFRKLDWVG
ncbi:MAG: LptF/LptG family permease [Rhizobacter sp.]|nr:LptF/LptG family permease [Bacteriovorax sp.]